MNIIVILILVLFKKCGQKWLVGELCIGVGCIVLCGEEILLVCEWGCWLLFKGGLEVGEFIQDGVWCEIFEEIGLVVELCDFVFIVEFQVEIWGYYFQFFYIGCEVSGIL